MGSGKVLGAILESKIQWKNYGCSIDCKYKTFIIDFEIKEGNTKFTVQNNTPWVDILSA
jgi:hypothetical protein